MNGRQIVKTKSTHRCSKNPFSCCRLLSPFPTPQTRRKPRNQPTAGAPDHGLSALQLRTMAFHDGIARGNPDAVAPRSTVASRHDAHPLRTRLRPWGRQLSAQICTDRGARSTAGSALAKSIAPHMLRGRHRHDHRTDNSQASKPPPPKKKVLRVIAWACG